MRIRIRTIFNGPESAQLANEFELAWPAKFREIFISHFAKFSNYFREISRNEITKISRKWSYKTVQKVSLSTF